MRRVVVLASSGVLALALVATPSARTVTATNGPTFRDCSLLLNGVDPDFVQIFGVTVTPQGTLTVPATATSVGLEASESNVPADQTHHVTFSVKVGATGMVTRTVSGAGTGKVFLTVPLQGARSGLTYTLTWAATFDNGLHACPGLVSPQNRIFRHPFLVTVT
jgi:hypothetical protein